LRATTGRGRTRKLSFQVTISAAIFTELYAELSRLPARERSLACIRLADRGVGVGWASLIGTAHAAKARSTSPAQKGDGYEVPDASAGAALAGKAVKPKLDVPHATPHRAVQDELEGFSLG